MSYLIQDIMAEYTDRQTGVRQVRVYIVADSVSDLPSNTANLTYLLGSYAKTVDTGNEYYIDSNGTWVLQPSKSPWSDVYTKSEVDALLQEIWDEIDGVNALVGSGIV